MKIIRVLLGIMAAAVPASAMAAETATYSYDALGRVVSITHAGGDNDGMANTLSYDAANNRTQYTVTGSKGRGLANGIVVVPLNGFTIIPIG